jgi:hypothetical protein
MLRLTFTCLSKRREDFPSDEAKLLHHVVVRHAGEIQAADQVVDAKRLTKALNLPNALVGRANNKAVTRDRFELID